nr:enzymatic polyprotein [Tanacetum cinerariifolium]
MKREEDIEKVLQNSSHGKPKWYVIFNGPFRGIYTDWTTASTYIIRKSVSHKSYLTKEAAEKALEESYKTIAIEETQKSKQFVSLNQHLQSQTAKLNAFNKMKKIPTAKEKEEMKRSTVENFQRLLDSLMNYNEVHATMLFYPKKRRNIGPKAVIMPEASPKDIYDYYVHGLVDTIYINGETLKELQEFPLKERIEEVQLKVLSDFEDQIELFSGLLAPLPEDLKQKLCSYMTRNTRHHCYYCSEGTSSSPIMEG